MKRALALGIDAYQDVDPPPGLKLEAPANDVANVRDVLLAIGFTIVEKVISSEGPTLTTNVLRRRIKQFLASAEKGDELLLYISAHGADQDGSRVIIPADYFRDEPQRASDLVTDHLLYGLARNSAAASVIIVIDSCREGVRLALAPDDVAKGMASQTEQNPAAPTVAIYYSSAPRTESWATNGEGAFSYFTSALCQVLRLNESVATLGDVISAVQRQLNDILPQGKTQEPFLDERSHTGRAGEPRRLILKEDEAARLRQRVETSRWCHSLRETLSWTSLCDRAPGLAAQVSVIAMRAGEMAEHAETILPRSAWQSADVFRRFNVALEELMAPTSLDVAELALCVAAPYVYEAALAGLAARLAETDALGETAPELKSESPGALPSRAWRQALTREEDWARRRHHLEAIGKHDAADDLRMWQLLSFAHRAGELWTYNPDNPPGPTGWLNDIYAKLFAMAPLIEVTSDERVREVLDGRRLIRLTRLMFAEPEDIEGEASKGYKSLRTDLRFGAGTDLWQIDEVEVAHVLALAAEMTLDARRLPPVVAEHLGLEPGLDLPTLQSELSRSRWQRRGEALVLALTTKFPPIHAALAIVATGLERHRSRIAVNEALSSRLEQLPANINDSALLPDSDGQGRPLFDRQHLRFTLDQQRVVSLLMGEALYGDPIYALRELYQNALDACRYRRARMLLLEQSEPFRGCITFRAESVKGRPVIVCEDDGIGMEERHLRDLFARAGRRFADSHEFHLDYAQWQDRGIKFWPNSRFGIGVLSYFMLAEEIEVQTRRLEPDGDLSAETLVARVTGSGSLFRITRERGIQRGCGTKVILYPKDTSLNADSLLKTVLDWLWIPEVDVKIVWLDGRDEMLQAGNPTETCKQRFGDLLPVLGSRNSLGQPRIYWCMFNGSRQWIRPAEMNSAVMQDGIALDSNQASKGLIVNLTEDVTGEISVDRKTVAVPDSVGSWVDKCLVEDAGRALVESDDSSSADLAGLAHIQPVAIIDLDRKMRAKDPLLPGNNIRVPFGRVTLGTGCGLCLLDWSLFILAEERIAPLVQGREVETLLALRLKELHAADVDLPPLLSIVARFYEQRIPIDQLLLPEQLVITSRETEFGGRARLNVGLRDLVLMYDLLQGNLDAVVEIARRVDKLGLLDCELNTFRMVAKAPRKTLNAFFLSNLGQPASTDRITIRDLIAASIHTSTEPRVIAALAEPLAESGIVDADLEAFARLPSFEQRRVDILEELDYDTSALGIAISLSRLHVRDRVSIEDLEWVMSLFGYGNIENYAELVAFFGNASQFDLDLFSRDQDGVGPYDEKVTLAQVVATAARHEKSVASVMTSLGKFESLGLLDFSLASIDPANLDDPGVRRLLSADLDGRPSFLNRVSIIHLARFLESTTHSSEEVTSYLEKLQACGLLSFSLADVDTLDNASRRSLAVLKHIIDEIPRLQKIIADEHPYPWEISADDLNRISYEVFRRGESYEIVLKPLLEAGVLRVRDGQAEPHRNWSPATDHLIGLVWYDKELPAILSPLRVAFAAETKGFAPDAISRSLEDLAAMGVQVTQAREFVTDWMASTQSAISD